MNHSRIYRSRNGSARTEAYNPDTGEVFAITIKNIPRAKYYVWIKARGWTEQPMLLPPGGRVPDQVPVAMVQQRREIREGFEVVRMEHPNSRTYMAPQLNMFVVEEEVRNCGGSQNTCVTRVTNIRPGNQARTLFEPPLDEPINLVPEPSGIVFKPKG